jgi:diphthamide biosynthesis methyltransferase
MGLEIGQTYKSPAGYLLKVKTIRETGLHTLILIDAKGEEIPERKNLAGHVVLRSERLCSTETMKSFKLIKIK